MPRFVVTITVGPVSDVLVAMMMIPRVIGWFKRAGVPVTVRVDRDGRPYKI